PATSNLSRRMHFQYGIFEPKNPTQAVIGTMNLVGGNFLQNGADLILDLQGPTGSEVQGLPTRLYLVPDASSATAFAGTGAALPAYLTSPTNYFTASGALAPPPGSPNGLGPPTSVNNWSMGLGDVIFKYVPDSHPVRGSLGSGTVVVALRGLLNY